MSICTCMSSWVLPVSSESFIGMMTDLQFSSELEKAKERAIYIMTGEATEEGTISWGISQEDFENDVSGQMQVCLELLTTSEFLKKLYGFYSKVTGVNSYSSPTGESVSFGSDQFLLWKKQSKEFTRDAFNLVYDFVSEKLKGKSVCFITNYNWEIA